MRRVNAFGHVFLCVCLSVCRVRALNFESFDIETLFSVCRYISLYLDMGQVSRSWGQGQGHMNITKYTHSRAVFLRLKGNLISIIIIPYLIYNSIHHRRKIEMKRHQNVTVCLLPLQKICRCSVARQPKEYSRFAANFLFAEFSCNRN